MYVNLTQTSAFMYIVKGIQNTLYHTLKQTKELAQQERTTMLTFHIVTLKKKKNLYTHAISFY